MTETPREPVLVDARGMRCPWPALRLARAMRDNRAAVAIRILADDANAAGEIRALAAVHGWQVNGAGPRFDLRLHDEATQSLPSPE